MAANRDSRTFPGITFISLKSAYINRPSERPPNAYWLPLPSEPSTAMSHSQLGVLLKTNGKTVLSIVALAGVIGISRSLIRRKRRAPGPKGWPIFGNILQLPGASPWLKLREWAEEYGMSNIYSI